MSYHTGTMPEQSPEEQFVPDNGLKKISDKETPGHLDLHSLTSAEGLTLPSHIGGYLDLRSLNEYDKELLRTRYPSLADKINEGFERI